MTYRVVILPEAEAELEEAYLYVREDSPARAKRWREKLLVKVKSLATFPERCAVAPESAALGVEVRHLVVGKYRMLFVVRDRTVMVLHVRHAARRRVTEAE